MTDDPVPDAAQSLKRNGKTFWLASLFLPKETAADAATLYAFCRSMDDLADQQGGLEAAHGLERVREELRARRSDDPVVRGVIQLAERRGLDLQAAECLLDVLLQDASEDVLILDEAQLLRYCYGAAGTVGLMMSAVLGASGAAARVQAIDLGIAMQLTNIARDVQEDALMGRRYLPADWVGGLEPGQIGAAQPGSSISEQTKPAIARTLALADVFYINGARGFPAIPRSARGGIRIAAAAYRHIGVELRRRDCEFTSGRVVISLPAKLWIAARVLVGSSELERMQPTAEVEALHANLLGFPGFA
jgi:phytoene synthase